MKKCLFNEVAETAEDETADADEKDEEPQLLVAVLQGVRDCLDTGDTLLIPEIE